MDGTGGATAPDLEYGAHSYKCCSELLFQHQLEQRPGREGWLRWRRPGRCFYEQSEIEERKENKMKSVESLTVRTTMLTLTPPHSSKDVLPSPPKKPARTLSASASALPCATSALSSAMRIAASSSGTIGSGGLLVNRCDVVKEMRIRAQRVVIKNKNGFFFFAGLFSTLGGIFW